MGVPVAPEAELQLGDGTVVRYRVCDLIPVYRSRRVQLQRLLESAFGGCILLRGTQADAGIGVGAPWARVQRVVRSLLEALDTVFELAVVAQDRKSVV